MCWTPVKRTIDLLIKFSFNLSPPVDGGPECTPGEETSVYLFSGNGNPRTSATS